MFGYIITNQDELKVKDVKRYHSYYCGLCRSLKEKHGLTAQATLTYDMTFLCILLSGLYDTETTCSQHRCVVHPFSKHQILQNEVTAYAADMNLLMAYYNLMDNWIDDKSLPSKVATEIYKKKCQKIASQYPRQNEAITTYMKELSACEERQESNLDAAASLTGNFLGEIFAWKKDEWYDDLWKFGFYLGKFIYLYDAYEDLEEDRKKNHYNPFLSAGIQERDLEEQCHEYLLMMAAEAARYFERLPIIENVDILRNIIYSGIWTKHEQIRTKRIEKLSAKQK